MLRALRDESRARGGRAVVRYVGISGYPLATLAALAARVAADTGEPLDAVQSYAHFTLQNTTLAAPGAGLSRLRAAGVDVVTNASPLAMGLLRRQGVPVGAQGDFHPAGRALRAAVRRAVRFCDDHGESIEVVGLRLALEGWAEQGAEAGVLVARPASGGEGSEALQAAAAGAAAAAFASTDSSSSDSSAAVVSSASASATGKLGVSVIGISTPAELHNTMIVWRSILDGIDDGCGRPRRPRLWQLGPRG